ncbi:hypothetical protein Tco_0636907 [Tanacetum coccineum]
MAQQQRTKQDWLHKGIVRKKELTMMKPLHQWQEWKPSEFLAFATYMKTFKSTIRCQISFLNGLMLGYKNGIGKSSQVPVKYLGGLSVLECQEENNSQNSSRIVFGEFWSTVVAFDLFPSTNEHEKCPLKEFLIKFSVLGRNYSSIKQVNSIQQLLAYSLITGTEVDVGEIIYSDLATKLLNKSRMKYVSYPRFISCALQVLLGSEYTQDKKFRDSVSPPPLAVKPKKGKSQTVASTLPKSQGLEASGALSKKSKKD